jgi:arylformamidase
MDKRRINDNDKDNIYDNRYDLTAVRISYENFYDLTLPIYEGMAVFPGDPEVKFSKHNTIQNDGYNVTCIKIGSHTGTHVDAQSHFLPHSNTVDNEPLDKFIGEAVIIDLSQKRDIGKGITYQDLDNYSDQVKGNDILLIYTASGNSRLEKKENGKGRRISINTIHDNNNNTNNITYLEDSAANWIVDHSLRCVGIDTFSVEKYGSKSGSVHKKLLSNQVGIIENLNPNMKRFVNRRMFLICLPLPLKGLDGSPSRVLLFDIL